MAELIGRNSEGMYLEKPLRKFEGKFTYPINDPYFRGGELLGQEFSINVRLAIHPNVSRRIIINIPGANGGINGYADKYKRLAWHMQFEELGAVIRANNIFQAGFLPDINLRAALQYARENAWMTCGEPKPETLLMGFSAGAGAIAAIAHEYPEVTRILLYAPSEDMPGEIIQEGLSKFGGEVYILIGEEDEVVGPDAGQRFLDMATGTSKKGLIMIPHCDHQFRGKTNGRIMNQAPFFAFARG